MDSTLLRKPRSFFDSDKDAHHVTFDDGWFSRCNLPWTHFVQANWDYGQPDTVRVAIGDLLVMITGHNLAPLFRAIEERSLLRVRAQPDLSEKPENVADCFVAEIRFLPLPERPRAEKA